MSRLRIALCVFVILLGGLAGSGTASASVTTENEPATSDTDDYGKGDDGFRGEDVPLDLDWQACFEEAGAGFECTTAHLPLDYDSLDGDTTAVELVRLLATGEKKGSMFLNPGGPGGSGVDLVLGAGPQLFTPEIRGAYDLIGFDPRGIEGSAPLICFDSFEEGSAAQPLVPFPTTFREKIAQYRADRILQSQCRRQGGDIKFHMSTANVARDLEVLRAAVGDEELNFYGLSYGSVVGQVYGGLFPDNVGRVVIDGVLDIQDWVGSTRARGDTVLNERIRSDLGAEDTFDEFLRLCDESGTACALAPEAEGRANAVLDGLKEVPLEITDPETGEVLDTLTYAEAISSTLGALYSPASWPFLAEFYADVESLQADPASPAVASQAQLMRTVETLNAGGPQAQDSDTEPPYSNVFEGFPGVTCVDTSNPYRFRAWSDAAARLSQESPNFGELWSWVNSTCSRWPAVDSDRFTGPFGEETANAILVMTTRYDPATSFEQAQSAAAALPNSSLVTVEGWGHTTLFTSACADEVLVDYLLNDVVPPTGTVCAPNVTNPFTGSMSNSEVEARAVLLQQTWQPGTNSASADQ